MNEFSKLPKKELVDILNKIVISIERIDLTTDSNAHKSDLESLIGTIPFLMQNKKIFEKNQDIADFAKKLNIYIPSPEKKKREDIIGRVIIAIAEFDNLKLSELNRIIKDFKNKNYINKTKSNFFQDWEEAISNINL